MREHFFNSLLMSDIQSRLNRLLKTPPFTLRQACPELRSSFDKLRTNGKVEVLRANGVQVEGTYVFHSW